MMCSAAAAATDTIRDYTQQQEEGPPRRLETVPGFGTGLFALPFVFSRDTL